jgi:hypothetical protein
LPSRLIFDHLRAVAEILAIGVLGLARDPADMHRTRQLGVHRVGDVILAHLAGAPAGDIQEPVIETEVDVGDQRRHGPKALQQRRQVVLGRWYRIGMVMVFLASKVPSSLRHQVQIAPCRLVVSTTTPQKPYSFTGSWAGPDFQRHLVVLAKIDGLYAFAGTQIPKMDHMTVFVAQQILRHDAILKLRWQPPF